MSVKGSAALATMIKRKSERLYGSPGGSGSEGYGSPGMSPVEQFDQGANTSSPFKPTLPATEELKQQEAPAQETEAQHQESGHQTQETKPAEVYQPKVVPFSGNSKCALCEKTVYKNEEIIAIGKTWHNTCFKCGGCTGDGCGRVLRRDNYTDHHAQPYCNACSSKLYKPQGYGNSGALHLDSGAPAQAKATISSSPDSTAVPVPPAQSLSQIKNNFESKEEYKPVKYQPKVVNMAFASTPKCTVCNKSVYKMEEMVAVGRIWHLSCFRCGGTANEGACGRVLHRNDYVDHECNPYCVPCHGKLFKPHGMGFVRTKAIDASALDNGPRDSISSAEGGDNVSAAKADSNDAASASAPSAASSKDPAAASAVSSKDPAAGSATSGKTDENLPIASLNIGASSRSAGGVFKVRTSPSV
jgi:cysteine/glycine-rich protein